MSDITTGLVWWGVLIAVTIFISDLVYRAFINQAYRDRTRQMWFTRLPCVKHRSVVKVYHTKDGIRTEKGLESVGDEQNE